VARCVGSNGFGDYLLKRYEAAVRLCGEFASRWPNLQATHLYLAGAYALSGRVEEAKAEAAQVLRINPGFTIERHNRLWVHKNPKDLEHRLDGLRKAGLPES
jgi:adenylate cyclase